MKFTDFEYRPFAGVFSWGEIRNTSLNYLD